MIYWRDPRPDEGVIQEIAPGVIISTAFRRLTVGAIITGSGIICVDVPPYPEDARLWRSLLQQRYRQPIRLVVVTDPHRDRLLGLYWFHDAQVIAHSVTYEIIRNLPTSFVEQSADLLARNSEERASFNGVRLRLPVVTFDDRMTAYVDNFGLPLLAMPGPTPGSIWVHLPEQEVVFTGDSVTIGQHPHMALAQSKLWLNSLSLLRRPRFAAEIIVPGRGDVTGKDATQALSEFLRYARRRVSRIFKSERPRADVAALVPTFMEMYPIAPGEQEDVYRRLRAGLENIYEEYRRAAEANEIDEDDDGGDDD